MKLKSMIFVGDKQETAINIGHSCRLLTKDTPLIILNQTSLDSTREEIVRELSKEKASQNETEDLSLIIDGKTLIHALEQSVRQEFIDLCTRCSAVICCRVSPIQKAEMVELVQEYTQAISLAIGDGANDVAMIQKAQVGVGISGNEGLQAVSFKSIFIDLIADCNTYCLLLYFVLKLHFRSIRQILPLHSSGSFKNYSLFMVHGIIQGYPKLFCIHSTKIFVCILLSYGSPFTVIGRVKCYLNDGR